MHEEFLGGFTSRRSHFRVGDRVKVKETSRGDSSHSGTIIDTPHFSNFDRQLRQVESTDDVSVYVLQFENGSVRRFTGLEIEPE